MESAGFHVGPVQTLTDCLSSSLLIRYCFFSAIGVKVNLILEIFNHRVAVKDINGVTINCLVLSGEQIQYDKNRPQDTESDVNAKLCTLI